MYPKTKKHSMELIFEDEHGDLVRCSCGEQGFDFEQGREWFRIHLGGTPKEPITTTLLEISKRAKCRNKHLALMDAEKYKKAL